MKIGMKKFHFLLQKFPFFMTHSVSQMHGINPTPKTTKRSQIINKLFESITVFDVVQSPPLCLVPCKFVKILVVDNFVGKNYIEIFWIRNYFKKIFFSLCTILQSSNYFFWKFSHQFAFFKLSMKLARAISSSSSSVKSDHLESIEFSSL